MSNLNQFYFRLCFCDDVQVAFYMDQYASSGMQGLAMGYEISTPAYPDPTHDKQHQLPLTRAELSKLQATQSKFQNGFLWEMFKAVDSPDHATPTEVAQAICAAVSPGSPRCEGSIPGSGPGHVCVPPGCNACASCCKSYLNTPSVCDACVQQECPSVSRREAFQNSLVPNQA